MLKSAQLESATSTLLGSLIRIGLVFTTYYFPLHSSWGRFPNS